MKIVLRPDIGQYMYTLVDDEGNKHVLTTPELIMKHAAEIEKRFMNEKQAWFCWPYEITKNLNQEQIIELQLKGYTPDCNTN